jgi:hypothetical protein
MHAYPLKIHQELDPEEGPVGRDPRAMSLEELAAVGFKNPPLLGSVRDKCLDCCCGSTAEVRRCGATSCALWPFRMGTNPWSRNRTPAQRAVSYQNLARLAENAPKLGADFPTSGHPKGRAPKGNVTSEKSAQGSGS